MPTNILSGNTAKFVVEFIDATGNLVSPSSASMTVNYLSGGVAASITFDLTLVGQFWTGNWSTVSVDVPSDAVWIVISSISVAPAQSGVIRIIDP